MTYADLTERERQTARMIAAGMTNAQIAAARGVQPATIRLQVKTICRKLDIRNRVVLAALVGEERRKAPYPGLPIVAQKTPKKACESTVGDITPR